MPPKRKRAEDASAEAPRATRTSTRLKAASNDAAAITNSNTERLGAMDVEPVTKKTKRGSTKTATGKGGKGGRGQSQQTDSSTNESTATEAAPSKAPPPPDSKPAATMHAGKPEPYSEGRARQLFKTYEDPDTPGEIGPEGFEKLCTDLDISLEGALPLVLAWQMHATEMARFKEAEWLKGTGELRVSNLQVLSLVLRNIEDLLLSDKPPIPSSVAGSIRKRGSAVPAADPSEPYNRYKYYQYAADTKKAYAELYAFCFALAKPPTARNIDMDTASAFWSVLVAPKYPIMNDILAFINEKGTYKGVNKDLWNMVLEFSRSIQPDLSTYEADGAWPTMLDDFVAWKKAKLNGEDVNVECDD
ncbi:hypothetical protein GSI_07241 [Ganoderma sinense ZZ0214-1]|uniref:Defective in cullin neddylation protein n=1 Tax=Ganoderma sinense ZZ0214-1 TaxID=1077348 RepID=A0A2G8S9X6_9APHY|nr:hypothetical protein GSI_07241 [Ganoderma sinense ZZ0214-1]